jgi:hypothetical protein
LKKKDQNSLGLTKSQHSVLFSLFLESNKLIQHHLQLDHGGKAAMTWSLCDHLTCGRSPHHGKAMTCGLCPHHPGSARMTSEQSSDHGETMTWSLCDHYPGRARMTSEQSSDHGETMTWSQSDHLTIVWAEPTSWRLCHHDIQALLRSFDFFEYSIQLMYFINEGLSQKAYRCFYISTSYL